jgi:hypothetical protein
LGQDRRAASACPRPSKPECHAPRSRDSRWFSFSWKRFAFNIASVYG